jgi:hypothetical protein
MWTNGGDGDGNGDSNGDDTAATADSYDVDEDDGGNSRTVIGQQKLDEDNRMTMM